MTTAGNGLFKVDPLKAPLESSARSAPRAKVRFTGAAEQTLSQGGGSLGSMQQQYTARLQVLRFQEGASRDQRVESPFTHVNFFGHFEDIIFSYAYSVNAWNCESFNLVIFFHARFVALHCAILSREDGHANHLRNE